MLNVNLIILLENLNFKCSLILYVVLFNGVKNYLLCSVLKGLFIKFMVIDILGVNWFEVVNVLLIFVFEIFIDVIICVLFCFSI